MGVDMTSRDETAGSLCHKTLALLATCLFAVGGANATGQDIIGVYFDEEATQTTYEPTPPDLGAPYWIAVKNMGSTSDFAGIHLRLTHNGEGAPYVTSLIGAQNPGMIDGIIMFGAQPTIPSTDLILIGEGGVSATEDHERMEIHVTPCLMGDDQTPAYITADALKHDLYPESGSFDDPVAVLNPDGPTPTSGGTWGDLKRLYR